MNVLGFLFGKNRILIMLKIKMIGNKIIIKIKMGIITSIIKMNTTQLKGLRPLGILLSITCANFIIPPSCLGHAQQGFGLQEFLKPLRPSLTTVARMFVTTKGCGAIHLCTVDVDHACTQLVGYLVDPVLVST